MVSDNRIVSDLIELCYAHGVKDVVLSPGSRNAPFSLSFQEDDRFTCYVIPDERAAGFFALGLSQYSGRITAICCTSGTASLNYGPALAEAYYQRIPVLAITADRPKEWINQGIGQSINQVDLYKNYILKSHSLPSNQEQHHYAARLVNEVLLCAKDEVQGPVHLNVPLYEPLYGTTSKRTLFPKVIRKAKLFSKVSNEAIDNLADQWNKAKSKLIVIGALERDEKLQKNLDLIVQDPSVTILTETHSNVYNPLFHPCIDRLIEGLDVDDHDQYQPDLLITFGQNLISKRLKYMLFKMDIDEHWHIDADKLLVDTYRSLTLQIDDHPSGFFDLFTPKLRPIKSATYQNQWQKLELDTIAKHDDYLAKMEYSDFMVFKHVLKAIPKGSFLQMGNSTVVRYIQLFLQRNDIIYNGNRGVSGIDGCSSTAAGAAWLNKDNLTVLISGDISFLYDVNAWWHEYISPNLRVIIVNNRGGGIFRIIKGPDQHKKLLESTFEVRHNYDASQIAKTYGLEYLSSSDEKGLEEQLEAIFDKNRNKATILEIFTPPEVNDKVLENYFTKLKA